MMETKTIDVAEVKWEATADLPGEAAVKVLRAESGRNEKTLLVRLQAGGRVAPHSHMAPVQHYVLEGEYQSAGENYGTGTYRLLPQHCDMSEISTRGGVTILMVYDPVSRAVSAEPIPSA